MSTEKFHNKGLSFYCKQEVEAMTSHKDGYFCGQCARSLIDFRDKTKEEYDKVIGQQKRGCGIFYADQIGDDYELKLNLRKPLLMISFFGVILFSRNIQAQNSTGARIEMAPMDSTIQATSDTTIRASSCKEKPSKTAKKHRRLNRRMYRRRLYVDGRFPFIHYDRKRIIMVGYW